MAKTPPKKPMGKPSKKGAMAPKMPMDLGNMKPGKTPMKNTKKKSKFC